MPSSSIISMTWYANQAGCADPRFRCVAPTGVAARRHGPDCSDKAVAIHYEHRRPPALRWAEWEERLRHQLVTALQLLGGCPRRGLLVGERLTHADIMAAVMVSFIRFTEPDEWLPSSQARSLTRRLEQTPAFLAVPIDKV